MNNWVSEWISEWVCEWVHNDLCACVHTCMRACVCVMPIIFKESPHTQTQTDTTNHNIFKISNPTPQCSTAVPRLYIYWSKQPQRVLTRTESLSTMRYSNAHLITLPVDSKPSLGLSQFSHKYHDIIPCHKNNESSYAVWVLEVKVLSWQRELLQVIFSMGQATTDGLLWIQFW